MLPSAFFCNFAMNMNEPQTSNDVIRIDVAQVLRKRLPRLSHLIPSFLVRWVEKTICQKRLNSLLEENAGRTGAEFCRGILKSLHINVEVKNRDNLPPKEHRRVVFVSNHPLGGLDGLALIDMVQRYYGGHVWFMVNDLLMAVKPLESVFLPVNKFGSQSRQSLKRIDEAFGGNDPIIIFPAGLVSRLQNVMCNGEWRKMVYDLEWRKSFINLCVVHKRDIVPLFFSGSNSMGFYKRAIWRKRLGIKLNIEMVYLPREMILAEGKSFTVYVGILLPHETITGGKDAQGFAEALRSEVYMLQMDSPA